MLLGYVKKKRALNENYSKIIINLVGLSSLNTTMLVFRIDGGSVLIRYCNELLYWVQGIVLGMPS